MGLFENVLKTYSIEWCMVHPTFRHQYLLGKAPCLKSGYMVSGYKPNRNGHTPFKFNMEPNNGHIHHGKIIFGAGDWGN
jgi:hypothetical protein